jgi:hypothetical protein
VGDRAGAAKALRESLIRDRRQPEARRTLAEIDPSS